MQVSSHPFFATMSPSKRTVLITGCSDGGIGAALAMAFHQAALHVYATARDLSKMSSLKALGIDLLQLDVKSETSIAACVRQIPSLDILVNNAGTVFVMPVVDLNIAEAKRIFDLNVWSYVAVTQAFLPLLLKSQNALIVNHTSSASVVALPWQSVYNSSKAAMAMISDTLRLELQPFNIQVVDLRSGAVRTNIFGVANGTLPEGSIYQPAQKTMEKSLRQEGFQGRGITATQFAEEVVKDLLKTNPPAYIWRGEGAWMVRLLSHLPSWLFEGMVKKMTGLDVVERTIKT